MQQLAPVLSHELQISNGGRLFNLLDPDPSAICPVEIADVLSVLPRFGGRARFPEGQIWSVAQHSMLVGDIVRKISPGDRAAYLWALLHDAHETYVGDIATPVKHAMGKDGMISYVTRGLDAAIAQRFGICAGDIAEVRPFVKRADQIALETERAQLMAKPNKPWGVPELAWNAELHPMPAGNVAFDYQCRLMTALENYHATKPAEPVLPFVEAAQ